MKNVTRVLRKIFGSGSTTNRDQVFLFGLEQSMVKTGSMLINTYLKTMVFHLKAEYIINATNYQKMVDKS